MKRPFIASSDVSETYATELLHKMLEIPSTSYQERTLAGFLVEAMEDLGFQTRIDVVGNVIGLIERGEGPTIMLLGHMDTVPGQFPVRLEDGKLYGRGAVDAKGPLAAMVCAAARAVDFPGRIVVIGVVEEETPRSRGAMEIRATHRRPDALIVGEPSGWSSVTIGYKGKLDLRYTVKCAATHPSNPEPKASELVVACWTALIDLLGPDASHKAFDRPGATLHQLNADLTSATAEFSVRTPLGFDTGALVSDLHERLLLGNLEVLNSVAACRAKRSNAAVQALVTGIRRLHARPRLVVKSGTADMNTLAEEWDIPMATYGPGDSRLDHAENEHIVLSEYLHGIKVLSIAISELAHLPGGTGDPIIGPNYAEGSIR